MIKMVLSKCIYYLFIGRNILTIVNNIAQESKNKRV